MNKIQFSKCLIFVLFVVLMNSCTLDYLLGLFFDNILLEHNVIAAQ